MRLKMATNNLFTIHYDVNLNYTYCIKMYFQFYQQSFMLNSFPLSSKEKRFPFARPRFLPVFK